MFPLLLQLHLFNNSFNTFNTYVITSEIGFVKLAHKV